MFPSPPERQRCHPTMSTGCLLLLCALVLLQVNAEEKKCTHGAAGDLVGHEIYLNSTTLTPLGRRQYRYPVQKLTGCALNGVSAKVCDLFEPEVTVEASLTEVRVRRFAPRLHPLRVNISLYCDPATNETTP